MKLYRHELFNPVLLLLLTAGAFRFGPEGIRWMWTDRAVAASVLAAGSVLVCACILLSRRGRPIA